jgi:hypothetical protein
VPGSFHAKITNSVIEPTLGGHQALERRLAYDLVSLHIARNACDWDKEINRRGSVARVACDPLKELLCDRMSPKDGYVRGLKKQGGGAPKLALGRDDLAIDKGHGLRRHTGPLAGQFRADDPACSTSTVGRQRLHQPDEQVKDLIRAIANISCRGHAARLGATVQCPTR